MGLLSTNDDIMGSHDLRSDPITPEERAKNVAEQKARQEVWAAQETKEKVEAKLVRQRLLRLRSAFNPTKFVEVVKRLREEDLADDGSGKVHPLSALKALGLYDPQDKASGIFYEEKPWKQCREIQTRVSPGRIWLEVKG